MSSPLKDAFEDLALSVSFFQSTEECQLANVFEAAEIIRYVNAKSVCVCVREREREREREKQRETERDSTIFTLLWVIRNLSASETITSSWSCIKPVVKCYTGLPQNMINKREERTIHKVRFTRTSDHPCHFFSLEVQH